MSGIHIIVGKPTIGAGLIASTIKGSGKYDYKVNLLTDKICSIDFFQSGANIGNSTFTIEEAVKHFLLNPEDQQELTRQSNRRLSKKKKYFG